MGDHEGRASLHEIGQPLLNQRLGFGIEARSRFVKN